MALDRAKKKVADNQSFRRRLSEATLSASFLNTLHITRVVEVFELGITPLELPVEYYLFLLQSKAVFLNLVYFRRALSSQPAPYQVLMIKCTKTT